MPIIYLPTRRMVYGSTRATRRAMHPPLQRECALMSALVKPIDEPADQTIALMAAIMLSPWIFCHILPFLKLEIGVSAVAPWRCRYATWRHMAAIGHSWGWSMRPCPINYPFTLLFLVLNRMLTNSA